MTMYLIAVLSVLLFGIFLALDLPLMGKHPLLRYTMLILAVAALIAVYLLATSWGDSVNLPDWCRILGWIFTITGGPLMSYSILVEIPLHLARRSAARLNAPSESTNMDLVQTGTYALCRHPGFLWMLLFLAGQVLLAQRTGMLELVFWWASLDFLVVAIQDYYIFPRRFKNYRDYSLTTPFLIPNSFGLKTAIRTFSGNVQ